jgi:hypothetical protein
LKQSQKCTDSSVPLKTVTIQNYNAHGKKIHCELELADISRRIGFARTLDNAMIPEKILNLFE